MNKKLVLLGTLIFFFTLLSFPLAGINLGTVQAQIQPAGVGERSDLGATVLHSCTINQIAAYVNRIHVRCAAAPASLPSVFYFAASTEGGNSSVANRFLALLNTSDALGKLIINVWFDNISANNPTGCNTTDCRKLTGIELFP